MKTRNTFDAGGGQRWFLGLCTRRMWQPKFHNFTIYLNQDQHSDRNTACFFCETSKNEWFCFCLGETFSSFNCNFQKQTKNVNSKFSQT